MSRPIPPARHETTRTAIAWAGLTLALVIPRSAAALDPSLSLAETTVEVWGLREGLNGSMVRSIAQTDDGYLWIVGYGGVARYDGARIVRLDIEPPIDVIATYPGPTGTMHVAARRGPIVCAERGVLVPCPASTPNLPSSFRVFALHQAPSGQVLLGTDKGLLRQQGTAFVLDAKGKGIDFGDPAALHVGHDGTVWIASSRGLFRETPSGFVPFPEDDPQPDVAARAFFETDDQRLWVLTESRLLRIERGTTTTIALPPELAEGWQSQIIQDRDGSVWVGGQRGLARYRPGRDRFDIYTKNDGLPDDAVSALFEDREGSLWVGTRSGSLAQFTDRTVSTKQTPPRLREESIESICEDAEGTMWYGNRFGLVRYRDGVERFYTVADGLPHERVLVVIPAVKGGLWLGTGAGLARFRNGNFERIPGFEASVFSLLEEPDGVLWIGTDVGVARFTGNAVQPLPSADGFGPIQVRGFARDDRGRLLFTSTEGMGEVVDGRIVPAPASLGPEVRQADRGLVRDRDGTLWFGVRTALGRLRGGKVQVFPAPMGAPRDYLFQVLPDDLGYLWFGSSRTITRVPVEALEAHAEGRRRDLPVVSFDMTDTRGEIGARRARNAGVTRTRDGRLWFATLRGMVTIDPLRLRTNPHPPPVVIERALVDGRPAVPGRETAFPPGPGHLEFHYAGVTLLEPRKAMHRYWLEGFDPEWIDAGTRRVAYYTNLPPGKYRFRVQASNADGVWNEAGATVAFVLAPHFHQTPWFYGLCLLAVGGIAFAFYRARLTRLRGQYLAVFAERSRVARELHDSLLQGMSAVALELANIRTALPGSAAGPAARLEAVEDALTQSLEETRRFVWNLREQPSGAGDLGLALSRLCGRLTEGKNIACDVEVEGAAVHLSHDAQGAVFKIAQEAITNALRHADARKIDVRLTYRDREVELRVVDDGRGFDPGTVEGPEQRHFGLVGMSERARRIGGRLTVDSTPGNGTRLTLVLPTGSRRSNA